MDEKGSGKPSPRRGEEVRVVDPDCGCTTCSMDVADAFEFFIGRVFRSRLRPLSRFQVVAIAEALRGGTANADRIPAPYTGWGIPIS